MHVGGRRGAMAVRACLSHLRRTALGLELRRWFIGGHSTGSTPSETGCIYEDAGTRLVVNSVTDSTPIETGILTQSQFSFDQFFKRKMG